MIGVVQYISDYFCDRNKNEITTIISFALLVGWIISFPYEGPVLYALISNASQIDISINSYNLLLLAVGLLLGGFIPIPSHLVRIIIILIKVVCLLISLTLVTLPERFWIIVIPSLSCAAGLGMSLYGHQIKNHVSKKGLVSVAPMSMVLACLVIIGTQILITAISTTIGFLFIEIILAISIAVLLKTDALVKKNSIPKIDSFSAIIKKFWLLFVFIFIITINAGIMFHIIFPVFSQYKVLASLYTNIPYIAAVIFFSIIHKGNKFNTLFVGLALWGISLLMFSHFTPSVLLFFLLTSTMLFASGIFDLFWWRIFTTSFDYVKNPATMFGLILSVNVLGSLAGGVLSQSLIQSGLAPTTITQLGLVTIMLSMVLIVPLNKRISPFLPDNEFLEKLHWNRIEDTDMAVIEKLSSREIEVYRLLLTGVRDKEIGNILNISLNTVKSHNRKIYSKLEVKNRIELRKHFSINMN